MRVVKESSSPAGVLNEVLAEADKIDLVIVIALSKDGTQFMTISEGSMWQKSFLLAFAQSWLNRWFNSSVDGT